MKKIIIAGFLALSVLGMAAQQLRFVEKCKITAKGKTKGGRNYVNCVSLQSGKIFNFTGVLNESYVKFDKGRVFRMEFYGNGYSNLRLETFDFLY